MKEFLPLCDVLFNVISLAGYFCNIVFDIVLGYALFEKGRNGYFSIILCFVIISLIISQVISFRWYLRDLNRLNITSNEQLEEINKKEHIKINFSISNSNIKHWVIICIHCMQLGVLWRYAKLFIPVDLRRVKHEVRDLCILRLIHGFCEAAPMLLLQLYLLITIQNDSKFLFKNNQDVKLKSLLLNNGQSLAGSSIVGIVSHQPSEIQLQSEKTFKDLNFVAIVLSLFSVCWALASFSKNVRLQKVHRLVLTWLGVIFQFLWRLGTVISRIGSLTVYASVYKYWIFLVIILHWLSMFLWLISPKNVFHGERISKIRKTMLSALIAIIYIFEYINLQEVNHRQKMFIFYMVMLLENTLLVCLWVIGVSSEQSERWYLLPCIIFGSFVLGILFMVIYYRFFHVRRLNWEAGGRYSSENKNKSENDLNDKAHLQIQNQPQIAGVFNCRFSNPVGNATKRKKKKPTTFVPPPNLSYPTQLKTENNISTPMAIPFWKRPLRSNGGSSENEGSVGSSRVNIHQKLQEKKLKQLAELKIIEEEIKQGKLNGPATNTLSSNDERSSLPRQPIPRMKKHINIDHLASNFKGGWDESSIFLMMDKSLSDIDELNNLNKFSATQYEEVYSQFALNGLITSPIESKNMSPISSITESTSLSRQQQSHQQLEQQQQPMQQHQHNSSQAQTSQPQRQKLKIPHNISRNHFSSILNSNNQSIDHTSSNSTRPFEQNNFLEINHNRQMSNPTYNSNVEHNITNNCNERLPYSYNVVPPPRSKLDSRNLLKFQHHSQHIIQQRQQDFVNKFNQLKQRSKTPEVLLAPHYLDDSRIYYDWIARECSNGGNISSPDENLDDGDDKTHRVPSDIDSQVSLPRSYTLPREFKYYRRNKGHNFVTSTNSSDGDVDSGDDNESELNSDNSHIVYHQQRQLKSRIKTANQINYNNQIPVHNQYHRGLPRAPMSYRRHETKL
ncbi:uncharacterized protein LOC129606176 [Condylostylus longicornis]|uniref:uncharacterized protein LOC129606176 n=1 Tax=Condylostylus longicornis TaxID=2530218 RepID=UPI00244E3123|nr:uncharacterized protein LOC129606176 [Condylostylus longicornis]